MNSLNEDLELKYLVKQPKGESSKKPIFIFLHGYGSNERDLFSLANYVPENFMVISARSPYTLDYNSYSFYDIDYSTGTKRINLEQAEKSRNTIKKFIDQLIEKYKIDPEQVYMGGFSQGAIMSIAVALTFPGTLKGIVAFSSSILPIIKSQVKPNEALKNLSVFMSHGIDDSVIDIALGREARDYLLDLGIKPEYYEFSGGHEIPAKTIRDFNSWINRF